MSWDLNLLIAWWRLVGLVRPNSYSPLEWISLCILSLWHYLGKSKLFCNVHVFAAHTSGEVECSVVANLNDRLRWLFLLNKVRFDAEGLPRIISLDRRKFLLEGLIFCHRSCYRRRRFFSFNRCRDLLEVSVHVIKLRKDCALYVDRTFWQNRRETVIDAQQLLLKISANRCLWLATVGLGWSIVSWPWRNKCWLWGRLNIQLACIGSFVEFCRTVSSGSAVIFPVCALSENRLVQISG